MQYSTAQFRKNLKIEIDGEPYTIVDFQHVKPGKGCLRPDEDKEPVQRQGARHHLPLR